MPVTKKVVKKTKAATGAKEFRKNKAASGGDRLDVIFIGPLLFVPTNASGNVTDVEVFSPANGHPMGAVFIPGVFYADSEIDGPGSERWPDLESFTLLDPHSYALNLTQATPSKKNRPAPFPVSAIPDTNHKVKPGRNLRTDWEIAITIRGQLAGWTSHRLVQSREGVYLGSDAPTSAFVAGAQRLTYHSVTGAEFSGISSAAKEYLRSNISNGGTLIVLGEVPYQSTLLHERKAVDSLAKLAGLDLHLISTASTASRARVTNHITLCFHSIVLA